MRGDLEIDDRHTGNCFFGVAISHRSGIFGKVKFYGDVDGGSNYNMFLIECLK